MRSPEGRARQRAGKNFEEELSLKYLSPGAFTVLTPQEYGTPPDPPSAPTQYRLTPNTRRRRGQAFSIIAEATSNSGSRSPSPSGRVSPFRGRGFNPIGSRHASPNPSPPPEDIRLSSSKSKTNLNDSPRKSQIPQPATRRGSGSVFGEKVTGEASPKFRRKNGSKLSPHLSKSLTNISPKNVANKPPPSPSRSRKFSKKPAFEQLSPISGSSPESGLKENKTQSSTSKIPRSSKSQPTSRKTSPLRTMSPNKHSSKSNSRTGSKSNSRNSSRDPSPSKGQTKIPVKNSYKEVSAKVNSFSKPKPKVPPKPQDMKSAGKTSDKAKKDKPQLDRKGSSAKLKNNKTTNNGNSSKFEGNNDTEKESKTRRNGDGNGNNNFSETSKTENMENNNESGENNTSQASPKNNQTTEMKHVESAGRLSDIASATTVVSSTTSTATQPLKIDANLDSILKEEFNKPKQTSMYKAAGRVLSATSVTNAINRMNDTVLNSQTLMKDHNISKLSPAASAIISLSNENRQGDKALDTKTATTALPTIETVHRKLEDVSQNKNNNFLESNSVFSVESFDDSVKNNFSSVITPDHKLGISGTNVQKSANERIREARTMIAADVKPIKILVKEKPSDVEVQSGNIRLPATATNGLNATPGLPPSEHQGNEQPPEDEEESKLTCCSRFFRCCRCKKPFKYCKKKPSSDAVPEKKSKKSTRCFGCRKRKEEVEQVISSGENMTPEEKKSKFFDRLKCCQSNKIGDTGCCPRAKRKQGWADRKGSILSDGPKSSSEDSNKCKNFFRRIFCCSTCCRCCKKTVVVQDPISRRESMLSKKKSLTPTLPVEDPKPKIDASLVEHASIMRGAIPILPIHLAWFCLILNVILPGIGTIFSGMFCLCLGKPRFSQHDGPRPRIGAFLINLIIGCGQLFTVLFCLVGWGWSIWWGVIMIKIARKHHRIQLAEQRAQEGSRPALATNQNHHARDPERGS